MKKVSENSKLCMLLLVKEGIDVNFNDSRLDLLFRRTYSVNYHRLTLFFKKKKTILNCKL